eukprot:sb/3463939/
MPEVIYFKSTVIRGTTTFNGKEERFQIDTSSELSWTRTCITKSEWESLEEFAFKLDFIVYECDLVLKSVDFTNFDDDFQTLPMFLKRKTIQCVITIHGLLCEKIINLTWGPNWIQSFNRHIDALLLDHNTNSCLQTLDSAANSNQQPEQNNLSAIMVDSGILKLVVELLEAEVYEEEDDYAFTKVWNNFFNIILTLAKCPLGDRRNQEIQVMKARTFNLILKKLKNKKYTAHVVINIVTQKLPLVVPKTVGPEYNYIMTDANIRILKPFLDLKTIFKVVPWQRTITSFHQLNQFYAFICWFDVMLKLKSEEQTVNLNISGKFPFLPSLHPNINDKLPPPELSMTIAQNVQMEMCVLGWNREDVLKMESRAEKQKLEDQSRPTEGHAIEEGIKVMAIGDAYYNIGHHEKASSEFSRALAIFYAVPQTKHVDFLTKCYIKRSYCQFKLRDFIFALNDVSNIILMVTEILPSNLTQELVNTCYCRAGRGVVMASSRNQVKLSKEFALTKTVSFR